MDLMDIKPQTITVEITHPGDGKPLGIAVELRSLEDDQLATIRRAQENKAFKREAKGKILTSEQFHADVNNTIYAAMVGWKFYKAEGRETAANFEGDEKPPFDRKTVLRALDSLEWFKNQISGHISETESFFTN